MCLLSYYIYIVLKKKKYFLHITETSLLKASLICKNFMERIEGQEYHLIIVLWNYTFALPVKEAKLIRSTCYKEQER